MNSNESMFYKIHLIIFIYIVILLFQVQYFWELAELDIIPLYQTINPSPFVTMFYY